MKKILSLVIVFALFLTMIPLNVFADESTVVITESYSAYEEFKAALSTGNKDALSNTNWSLRKSGTDGKGIQQLATLPTLSDISIKSIDKISAYDYGSYTLKTPTTGPNAFRFDVVEGQASTVGVYDTATYPEIAPRINDTLPSKGLLMSVTRNYAYQFAITFTAPKDGTVTLSDPNGGEISVVQKLDNNCETSSFNTADKIAYFAIFKNNKKIWPATGCETISMNKDHFAFPEINDIEVEQGDTINFVFDAVNATSTNFTMALALNPVVGYQGSDVVVPEEINSFNAHDDFSAALATGNKDALSNTNWSLRKSGTDGKGIQQLATLPALSDISIKSIDKISAYGYDGSGLKYPTTGPNAFRFDVVDGQASTVGAYDTLTYPEITPRTNGTLPSKGLLMSVTRNYAYQFAITFTAPKDGTVTLSDPDAGYISVVKQLDSTCSTASFDDGNNKVAYFAIFKNNEKIWPATGCETISVYNDHFAFPEINDIDVKQGDTINLVFDAVNATATNFTMSLALNPQIDYQIDETNGEKVISAYSDFKSAIATNTTEAIDTLNWSLYHGADVSSLSKVVFEGIGTISAYDYGNWKLNTPTYGPNAYYFNNKAKQTSSIAAYDSIAYPDIKADEQGTLPNQGILMSVTKNYNNKVSITYKVTEDGRITLFDPNDGYITVVDEIGVDCKTGSTDTADKKVNFAIYKNNEKIWPQDADYYQFTHESTYIAFPEIKHLNVVMGDTLNLVFDGVNPSTAGTNFDMAYALNPQVKYEVAETGDANDDGEVNILDLIRIKKGLLNLSPLTDVCDLDGDGSYLSADLIILRKYLLGVISVFPVDEVTVDSTVTKLVTNNGRTYVEKNGQPYNMQVVHLRPELVIRKYGTENLDSFFAKAAELGFNAVACQIHWNQIENAYDEFDWSLMDMIYGSLNKYDLDIQILWCGSNNCGWYQDNVPAYIVNGEEYTKLSYTDPNGTAWTNLDYSDADLIAREKNAITKLMEYLAVVDVNKHTVSIQVENEPNGVRPGFPAPASTATADEVAASTWVGGQETAILNLINELGLIIKNSPNSCITRVNLMTYPCLYNGTSNSLEKVCALEGVDIVGFDCFEPDTTMDTGLIELLDSKNSPVPHIAESVSGTASIFNKMLNAYKLGGFLNPYQLKETSLGEMQSIFRFEDTDTPFVERDGTMTVGTFGGVTYYEAATSDWKSFNRMLKAAYSQIASCSLNNFAYFNAEQSTNATETLLVGGSKTFEFSSTTDKTYGGVGFAMKANDGSYLIYAQRATTVTVSGLTSTVASKGYYNNGVWVETGTKTLNNNVLTITEEEAAAGVVFRITQ